MKGAQKSGWAYGRATFAPRCHIAAIRDLVAAASALGSQRGMGIQECSRAVGCEVPEP